MAELATLTSKRATIKGHLTRFVNLVQSILDYPEINEKKLLQLPMRVTTTEPLLAEFNQTQVQIESLQAGDDGVAELNEQERDNFENNYYTYMQLAKNLIARYNPGGSSIAQPNNNQASSAQTPVAVQANLPKVDVPTFSGDYHNWLEFRDTFNSLIHSNSTISNIQKFHYLKASLKGRASNIVQSVEFSEANYIVAWHTLLDRYDDKWLIVYNHVKAIFNLPALTKESHSLLRQLNEDFAKHLHSLKVLGQPVEHWDTLLIFIISKKLDPTSKREWEAFKYGGEIPTVKDITVFLKDKCKLLEKLSDSVPNNVNHYKEKPKIDKDKGYSSNSFVATNANSTSNNNKEHSCSFCKQPHSIYECDEFVKLPVESRYAEIKNRRLCLNCLKGRHYTMHCRAKGCRDCGRKHNTLLHLNAQTSKTHIVGSGSESPQHKAPEPGPSTTIANHAVDSSSQHILLATAIVRVQDKSGNFHNCRVLLDSGSQSNFVTQEFCNRLQLPKTKINIAVSGINQIVSNLTHKTELNIQSYCNAYNWLISCIVISKITENVPSSSFGASKLNIPKNIKLADGKFNVSNKVDVLIGAQIFYDLLCIGQIKLKNTELILQKTKLGWVLAGPIGHQFNTNNEICCNLCVNDVNADIQQQLTKFWDLEECSLTKALSREEKSCEEHFINTTTRGSDGRFHVAIPLKGSVADLGDSRELAIKRFQSLERKLEKNPNLKQQYRAFMNEYTRLGHMTKITKDAAKITYYLPHHGVIKEDSITTKLRVVFDGSAKSTSGVSINDLQMVGPVIQDDLFSILIRFRKHKYVISSDIAKMYRQVCVQRDQRDLQRIIWRENPSDPLIDYTLNTVTYGTAAASFLAIRSLQQLAHEAAVQYPRSSAIILRDFYVYDLLTGSDSIEEAISIRDEVTAILQRGCFELRKWVSNEPKILKGLSSSLNSCILDLGSSENAKTLGLIWLPKIDAVSYNVNVITESSMVTKRYILAATAKIFDPLGLLAPSIIIPKTILQKLWQFKLSWDESVPNDLHTEWLRFQNELTILHQIKIPRHVIINNPSTVEIHGFSDACESAYGACVYIRSIDVQGNICVKLLCAKSKVAPIKNISIPRLELCGALLLARLVSKVKSALNTTVNCVTYWCDSTITIAWIKTPPNTLKTFVANRVAEIQELTCEKDWHHVRSTDNPADLLSRGISPKKLIGAEIWWEGPKWLAQPIENWPFSQCVSPDSSFYLTETKQLTTALITTRNEFCLFQKFSSLTKLQRCVAYCLRFKFNALNTAQLRKHTPLSLEELNYSLHCLVKIAQGEAFAQEIADLKKQSAVNSKSKLLRLNPFIDEVGLIRVGGRLDNSNFNQNKKHPILLPSKHKLTLLIVEYEHKRTLHTGPQALLASLRENYWPISGRNIAKQIVHNCINCFRVKPRITNPIMGSLPNDRVTPSCPFSICGVDYCGPILTKDKKGRGCRSIKSYICIFVCFATKAMHLELVSDLTTEAFLAALKRFVARRGKPAKIYSDNAKNFVGADAELKWFIQSLNSQPAKNYFENALLSDAISWQFIPPRSPHFGGLWEAGVKSVKFHLKRVVGNAMLTFEELYTTLTQIEAVVNSRPLSPLSNDPTDPNPLTPAHFLIGRSLVAVPEPNLADVKESRLSRFQRVQQIAQHFWKRWSKEYLSELQGRSKWQQNRQCSIKTGAMVIIREDNLPPLKWNLGRVVEVHLGPDGIVRVASVKTASGIYKRSVSKLCALPLDQN